MAFRNGLMERVRVLRPSNLPELQETRSSVRVLSQEHSHEPSCPARQSELESMSGILVGLADKVLATFPRRATRVWQDTAP